MMHFSNASSSFTSLTPLLSFSCMNKFHDFLFPPGVPCSLVSSWINSLILPSQVVYPSVGLMQET